MDNKEMAIGDPELLAFWGGSFFTDRILLTGDVNNSSIMPFILSFNNQNSLKEVFR